MKSLALLGIPLVLVGCIYAEYELMFTALSGSLKALGFVALSVAAILCVVIILQGFLTEHPDTQRSGRRRAGTY